MVQVPSPTKAQDFIVQSEFHGYRHKEDKTNLPPGYLVVGSQNVLSTTGGRIGLRKGYTLDGQASATIAPILSSFEWDRHTGEARPLRVGNGKHQCRYVATAGDKYNGITFTADQVYWIDIQTGLTSNIINYADYWDTTNLQSRLLWVNQSPNIYEWSGGITTTSSYTANTITKTGSETWAEIGFSPTTGSVTINGTVYAYTGGTGTTTLTGVTPNPVAEPVQSVAFQTVVVTANSAMTALPTFNNNIIGNLRNQIYIGANKISSVYISRTNNYKSYSFTSPVRVVGEGALVTLDGVPVAFVPQEDSMYVTASKDQWYQTKFTLSSDLTKEDLSIVRLKTSALQAARSQSAVTKVKNSVMFINNEPTLDELGRVTGVIPTPQAENISDPIKLDFDSYDFTDCSLVYYRNFIYIAVPRNNTVRIYNMAKGWWEAPQVLPVSRFAIIDGELYGHSYDTPETFKLFDGYSDNGNVIDARALFSYQNYKTRSSTKFMNSVYVEGYLQANTTLNLGIRYEIDGCGTQTTYPIVGSDTQIVCIPALGSPLGKTPLGKNPLGGDPIDPEELPPKFREIQTFPRQDFFEVQYSFSSLGKDLRWELLGFGGKVDVSPYGENFITK